jgi:glucose/mannose-6-phosphate isomerase
VVNDEILDSEEAVRGLDRSGMLSVVSRLPEMIGQAERFSAGISLSAPGKISQVMVLGLGGSAIAGDIASDVLFKRAKVPILTNRQYTLPEFVGPETFIFALSYSGETEEVLSAVKEAERRGSKVVCITSGGKLKEIAENKKHPLFLIPTGYQPRAALPFMLIPLLTALEKVGMVPPLAPEIKGAITLLSKLRDEFGTARPARINAVKQFARKLMGKIPIIFGSSGTTGAAALRFKTQLNENSKLTAHVSLFPELDHNEIVNLAALKRDEHDFFLIVLRDEDDGERVKKRIEITKSILSRQLGGFSEIVSQGKSPLARVFSLIMFCDFVSVYLAVLRGIDPTPVEAIARLKKEMTR